MKNFVCFCGSGKTVCKKVLLFRCRFWRTIFYSGKYPGAFEKSNNLNFCRPSRSFHENCERHAFCRYVNLCRLPCNWRLFDGACRATRKSRGLIVMPSKAVRQYMAHGGCPRKVGKSPVSMHSTIVRRFCNICRVV